MQLSQEAIEEFKEIYREECGEDLSDIRAVELATSFFHLMRVIYRPLPGGTCTDPSCTVHSSSSDTSDGAPQTLSEAE